MDINVIKARLGAIPMSLLAKIESKAIVNLISHDVPELIKEYQALMEDVDQLSKFLEDAQKELNKCIMLLRFIP